MVPGLARREPNRQLHVMVSSSVDLWKRCKFILTDLGGLQEEATVPSIRKPVVLVRLSTERPEGVDAGLTTVAGISRENILSAIENLLRNPPSVGWSLAFR
jgi:UDP-N-acetylglucosamine 2-epimerase (non-hydrolysing)